MKAVFLDRDGVLNESVIRDGKPYPPETLNDVIIPSDVLSALLRLKKENFLLIVVTNQPDVARGKTTKEAVDKINDYLCQQLPIHAVYVCWHDDKDQCACRKPLPGLLLAAAEKHNIDLNKSFLIGDRWKDIAAGQKALCKTVWLNKGYDEIAPITPAHFTTTNLTQAADWILQQEEILTC